MGLQRVTSLRYFCRTSIFLWCTNMQDLCGKDDANSDEVGRSSVSLVDHEERRMSDLSDFCWSVVSSVDNHVNGDNQVNRAASFRGQDILYFCTVTMSIILLFAYLYFHFMCIFVRLIKMYTHQHSLFDQWFEHKNC